MDINYILMNFDCNYETGDVFRVGGGATRIKCGTECNGYLRTHVNGKLEYNHRLIWAHYYREDPPEVLDHVNRNRMDNSISNLRASNHSLNQLNRTLSKNNTTGYTGVSIHRKSGKFKATIYINSKPKHLGLYETAEKASDAYLRALSERVKNALV